MRKFKAERRSLQRLVDIASQQSAENHPDALQTWNRSAALSQELLGPYHGLTLFCYNHLGKTLVDIGEYEQAILVLEPVLELARGAFGLVHARVEHACQSLGRAYSALGDHVKADQNWEAAAYSSEKMRGVYHLSTIFCLSRKARALRLQGLHEEALTVFSKVFGRTQHVFGCNLQTAFAARELAACYCQLGRFQEAIPIWKHALRCFDEHPNYHKHSLNVKRCLSWTRNQAKTCRTAGSQAGASATADTIEQHLDPVALRAVHAVPGIIEPILYHDHVLLGHEGGAVELPSRGD